MSVEQTERMLEPNDADALTDGLVLASDLSGALGEDLRLRRLAGRGHLYRFYRGQYIVAARWREFTPDQQYELRVRGAALARRGSLPVSHQSAAVLWGLPILVPWPREVHFLIERAAGGRSDPGIRKHALGIHEADVTERDGVLLTTVGRTVVDLAATMDLKSAVAAVDRALAVDRFGRVLPLTTREELFDTWERMLPFRGSVRARAIIDFGTHLSGSSSESGSRVNIALSGFPAPELQHRFEVDGRAVETDFFWRDYDCVGECDGAGKYFDPVMLGGRTPAEVVYAEKLREDGIRRQVRAFTRWDTATGLNQYRLRARLLQLGLPVGPSRLNRG
ncbi:Transcriptional regulator, AbiEi antitoxin, Type IV TA system [Cryobacterium psychrotolerans]|uniref:Transcriptional regulator, AbiEi antitoxin, Type IV TA system n=2 Tax=Cryobacterium psychrotolerans TaxID=386301 RepID=A0A1G9ANI7_9MICO|nr:Transcriptional regulator, AbiEi antitoxin, Type IV TA system [Cryobacterium psychrotolerans]